MYQASLRVGKGPGDEARCTTVGEPENTMKCSKALLSEEVISKERERGHSMPNQHKKILTLTDLNETWFLHSVC